MDLLWDIQGIEADEQYGRTLRTFTAPAVIYRKLSTFGTQKLASRRSASSNWMLTVCETCRLQKRSVFQWLTTAVEAKLHNRPAPTLSTEA